MVWTEFWRIHADKNAQILGFWDQASDVNFPGPPSHRLKGKLDLLLIKQWQH